MSSDAFRRRLVDRAILAGIELPDALSVKLETYFELLARWNARMNLAGMDLSNPGDHAIDRLLIEPVLAARACLEPVLELIDIGSGGGSPGIPLALALSVRHLRLVESRGKKAVFLREAARAVDLSAEVLASRFEDVASQPRFQGAHDALSVRAVRIGSAELRVLAPLLRPGGALLLFRGPDQEAPEQSEGLARLSPVDLVPGSGDHLVVYRRTP